MAVEKPTVILLLHAGWGDPESARALIELAQKDKANYTNIVPIFISDRIYRWISKAPKIINRDKLEVPSLLVTYQNRTIVYPISSLKDFQ